MQVLINGKVSGFFERSNPRKLPLPSISTVLSSESLVFSPSMLDFTSPSAADWAMATWRLSAVE